MDNFKKASISLPKEEVFTYWLTLTQPFHKLSKSGLKVVAEMLKLRHDYSSKIIDEDLLDEFLLSTENRSKIMDAIGMEPDRFNNILSELRKGGVLVDNKISPKCIPNIKPGATKYSILFELNLE